MSEPNEPLRRLVAQVGDKTDVLVGGTPVQARQLLAEAGAALAGQATVVSVASPLGELSLSTLIAQLSGRLDFDDQDDAVLELGYKRLKGDGQTVLMVLAPGGTTRSALRYLQHVSRQSPGLTTIVYRAPPLIPMLEEPAFATLRERLHALPAIEFDVPAVVVPGRALAVVPPAPTSVSPLPVVFPRRRRRVLWAASVLAAAAVAFAFWLGYSAPGGAVASNRTTHSNFPLVAATMPAATLAGLSRPVPATVPLPPLVTAAGTGAAKLPQIALATLPAQPPSIPLAHPDALSAGVAQPQQRAERAPLIKRPLPRFAQTRPYWPGQRDEEPVRYEHAPPWDGVSPIWVRRDLRRREAPYLGTYAVGPNGVRIFQYDP